MSVELRYITQGLLCKFYGFTLTEVRAMDNDQLDVFIRYMDMTHRWLKQRERTSGYGDS